MGKADKGKREEKSTGQWSNFIILSLSITRPFLIQSVCEVSDDQRYGMYS